MKSLNIEVLSVLCFAILTVRAIDCRNGLTRPMDAPNGFKYWGLYEVWGKNDETRKCKFKQWANDRKDNFCTGGPLGCSPAPLSINWFFEVTATNDEEGDKKKITEVRAKPCERIPETVPCKLQDVEGDKVIDIGTCCEAGEIFGIKDDGKFQYRPEGFNDPEASKNIQPGQISWFDNNYKNYLDHTCGPDCK